MASTCASVVSAQLSRSFEPSSGARWRRKGRRIAPFASRLASEAASANSCEPSSAASAHSFDRGRGGRKPSLASRNFGRRATSSMSAPKAISASCTDSAEPSPVSRNRASSRSLPIVPRLGGAVLLRTVPRVRDSHPRRSRSRINEALGFSVIRTRLSGVAK